MENASIKDIKLDTAKRPRKRTLSNQIKGLLFGCMVLVGNGIHPIINNSRPVALDAFNFVFQMSIFEFLLAIPICLLQVKNMKKKKTMIHIPSEKSEKSKYLLKLFLIGLIFTVANYFYVIGLEMAGSVSGSIALKVSPLYLLIIGILFLKERFDWKQLIIVVWMLVGLFYLATNGTWQIEVFSAGFGILLITPLLWSIGHAITKTLFSDKTVFPSMVILVRTGVIAVLMFGFILLTKGWNYLALAFVNSEFQWFSFLMGLTYLFMHFGWYSAIKLLDPSFCSALVTPSPALTMIFAFWFSNESIFGYQIWGMIWVFTGLYLLLLNKYKNSKRKREETLEKSKDNGIIQSDAIEITENP